MANRYIFRAINEDGIAKHYAVNAHGKKDATNKIAKACEDGRIPFNANDVKYICDNESSFHPAYDGLMASVCIKWIH